MAAAQCVVVTTTVGSAADADRIARALVDARLAACVQSWAVASCYRWQGAIAAEAEVRLDIKTSPDRVDGLVARLAALHPYDVPEILVSPVGASPAYAEWVASETR